MCEAAKEYDSKQTALTARNLSSNLNFYLKSKLCNRKLNVFKPVFLHLSLINLSALPD